MKADLINVNGLIVGTYIYVEFQRYKQEFKTMLIYKTLKEKLNELQSFIGGYTRYIRGRSWKGYFININ